jgi:hypothetical protein
MNKKHIRFLVILVVILVAPLLLWKGGLFAVSLYQNCNPDHINLDKDGWEKVFTFTTIKKHINVDIYGKSAIASDTGEFVVVRTGILPFRLKLISAVMKGEYDWSRPRNYNNKRDIVFSVNFGYSNDFYNKYKHYFAPFIGLMINYLLDENKYELGFLVYSKCDDISICTDLIHRIETDEKEIYRKAQSYQLPNNLYKKVNKGE